MGLITTFHHNDTPATPNPQCKLSEKPLLEKNKNKSHLTTSKDIARHTWNNIKFNNFHTDLLEESLPHVFQPVFGKKNNAMHLSD
jgi:hypothetical protein